MNDLLTTQATNEVIAETVSDIHLRTELQNTTATIYFHSLWTKVLRSGQVNDEAQLEVLFIAGLRMSIHHTMKAYWGSHRIAFVKILARHVDSPCQLQGGMKFTEEVDNQMQPGSK